MLSKKSTSTEFTGSLWLSHRYHQNTLFDTLTVGLKPLTKKRRKMSRRTVKTTSDTWMTKRRKNVMMVSTRKIKSKKTKMKHYEILKPF